LPHFAIMRNIGDKSTVPRSQENSNSKSSNFRAGYHSKPVGYNPRCAKSRRGMLMKLLHCLCYLTALSCLVLICGPAAYAQGNDAPEGVWESPDNRGGAVGIEVHKVKPEDGHTALEIGVYRRARDGWHFKRLGDENFFDSGYSEGLLVI